MDNQETVEKIKKIIMDDLFVDVNVQNCLVDFFLQNPKEFNKRKENLNIESVAFFTKCLQQLKYEGDKGNILFFRKYNYEKILNMYLSQAYKTKNPGMTLFSSERKINKNEGKQKSSEIRVSLPETNVKEGNGARKNAELQRQKQAEIEQQRMLELKSKADEDRRKIVELQQKKQAETEQQRLKLERKRQERERIEKDILSHIKDLKWEVTPGVSYTTYKASYYDGKTIELRVTTTRLKFFDLWYDHKIFHCIEYDGITVLNDIKGTHPILKRNNNITYAFNKDLDPVKKIDPKTTTTEQSNKDKKTSGQKKTKKKKQTNAQRRKTERKITKEESRIRWSEQEERMRKREAEQLGSLIELPQIGTKDFLVRRAVFNCMHSKHTVKDIDAAVKVVGDDGKTKLVKISAGYCEQCKIYFILESTYEKLKNMGVILCRVSDEKTYMKNSWVNGVRLAQESILMQFGYTVSQTEGLSSTRRQKILAVMIDNHIITKSEIISYLDFFISQRLHQSKFELAITKWEEDREFVLNYKAGQFTQYGVNAIYRR